MLRVKLVVIISAVSIPLVLSVACKDSARDAMREQQRQDSLAKAIEQQRQDSIAKAEAEAQQLLADSMARVEAEANKQPDPALKFHVIVGGFVIQSNADNYLSQMQGQYSAARLFVAPNGFKLVSIGDFATYAEALQMMRGVGREDLWVYEEGGPYDTSSWLENRGDEYGGGSEGGYSNKGGSTPPVDEFDK